MRVVIIITPGAPRRANKKGRGHPYGMTAVERVQWKKDVIALCGPRPVVDAHAVFRPSDGKRESACVAGERGHGKPHAASTCLADDRPARIDQRLIFLRCPGIRVGRRQVARPGLSGTGGEPPSGP